MGDTQSDTSSRLTDAERREVAAAVGAARDAAISRIIQRRVDAALAQVVEAFDPGELDCGRLGLPCTSVTPADRWCRACRVRIATGGAL